MEMINCQIDPKVKIFTNFQDLINKDDEVTFPITYVIHEQVISKKTEIDLDFKSDSKLLEGGNLVIVGVEIVNKNENSIFNHFGKLRLISEDSYSFLCASKDLKINLICEDIM